MLNEEEFRELKNNIKRAQLEYSMMEQFSNCVKLEGSIEIVDRYITAYNSLRRALDEAGAIVIREERGQ